MTFSPAVRRFLLTVHVAVSVSWLGAIAAYIALNVSAMTSTDPQTVRAAYLMLEPVALYAIVPMSVATSATGIIQSLGSPWGLLRHYWVVLSLVITLFASAVLLAHTITIRELGDMARAPAVDMRRAGGDLFHSIGGLIVLLVPLWLNMYKPRGLTRRGWRHQRRRNAAGPLPEGERGEAVGQTD